MGSDGEVRPGDGLPPGAQEWVDPTIPTFAAPPPPPWSTDLPAPPATAAAPHASVETGRGKGWAVAALVVIAAGILGGVAIAALFASAEVEDAQANPETDAWTLFFGIVFAVLWAAACWVVALICATVAAIRAMGGTGRWHAAVIVAVALTWGPAALMVVSRITASVTGSW